jgi:hypothetical protein
MTEQQWLASTDPDAMARFLWTRQLDYRKLRLCALACCRRAAHLLHNDLHRQALDVAARYADGKARYAELALADHLALNAPGPEVDYSDDWRDTPEARRRKAVGMVEWAACSCARASRIEGVTHVPGNVLRALGLTGENVRREARLFAQCFRDIIGNPFRNLWVDTSWLTSNGGKVKRLAEKIDRQGCYEELPALAEALEQAGCSDANILSHCWDEGPHHPGCWVPELLLQKSDAICKPAPKDDRVLRRLMAAKLEEIRAQTQPAPPWPTPEELSQKTVLFGILHVERWPIRESHARTDYFGTVQGYYGWDGEVALVCEGVQGEVYAPLSGLLANSDRQSFTMTETDRRVAPDYFAFSVELTNHLSGNSYEQSSFVQPRFKAVAFFRNEVPLNPPGA